MRTGGVVGNHSRSVLLSRMRWLTSSDIGAPFGDDGICWPSPTEAGGCNEEGTSFVDVLKGFPKRSISNKWSGAALVLVSAAQAASAHVTKAASTRATG